MDKTSNKNDKIISLSDSAINQFKTILLQENNKAFVRLLVDSGGCSGFSYKFSVDKKIDYKSDIILLEEKNGLSDNVNEVQLLMKLIKQRKDSLTLYKEQKREDLASKEESEILIIEEFLPKQLSDGELSDKIEKIINEFEIPKINWST